VARIVFGTAALADGDGEAVGDSRISDGALEALAEADPTTAAGGLPVVAAGPQPANTKMPTIAATCLKFMLPPMNSCNERSPSHVLDCSVAPTDARFSDVSPSMG
jgi:hypothetical protein